MVGQEFEVERQKRRLMTVVVHPAWFNDSGGPSCLVLIYWTMPMPYSTFDVTRFYVLSQHNKKQ